MFRITSLLEDSSTQQSRATSHQREQDGHIRRFEEHEPDERRNAHTQRTHPRKWSVLGRWRRIEEPLDAFVDRLARSYHLLCGSKLDVMRPISCVLPDLCQRARQCQWSMRRANDQVVADQLFLVRELAIGDPTRWE